MAWRVGRHYPIHVYDEDTPVATFFREEDARRAVESADEIERLRAALKSCTDRFERCILATGTDPEFAASAVQRYRDLLV